MTEQTNSETTLPKFRENAVCKAERNAKGITIHVRGVDAPIKLDFASCSEAVRNEAMGYGLEVRLTRAAAIERDTKTGKSATPQEKYEAIRKLAEHYASGTDAWAMTSSGGGGLNADTTALIEAVERALKVSREQAEEAVRGMTGAERAALRLDEEIKPHLDAVYAERAKAQGTDTKALLNKLRKVQG